MQEIIDIFRMKEVGKKTRADIIIELGRVINMKYAANITEPLVCELVKYLDPENAIFKDEHYIRYIKKDNPNE
jgi:hypothetical protein